MRSGPRARIPSKAEYLRPAGTIHWGTKTWYWPHVQHSGTASGSTYVELFLDTHAYASRASHIRFESFLSLTAGSERLAVESQTRSGTLDPVHHHERDDRVFGEGLLNMAPVMELFHEPGEQPERRVAQREPESLRSSSLLLEVATLVHLKVTPHPQRLVLKRRVQ